MSTRHLTARTLTLLAAPAAWQSAANNARNPFFPPPARIAERMYDSWFSGPATRVFLTADAEANLLPSLGRLLGGLLIGIAAGQTLGFALGRSGRLRGYLDPVLQLARALPPVALVPAFLAVFGFGTPMELALIAFGAFWPVLLHTADGVRSLDPLYVDSALVLGLGPVRRAVRVTLPAAAPRILTGMRLALSLGLILMVYSELSGATNGIGYELADAGAGSDYTGVWAGITLLGLLGLLLNALLGVVEHTALAWHRGARGRDAE